MQNRFFFPSSALDEWIVDGTVELQGTELTIVAEARRYKLVEAVHVVREVSGNGDPHELVGRVKATGHLEQLGAEIVETSMLLGDSAYDIEPGWLGIPTTSFAEHVTSDVRKKARTGRFTATEPKTDEDLLAKFLTKNL